MDCITCLTHDYTKTCNERHLTEVSTGEEYHNEEAEILILKFFILATYGCALLLPLHIAYRCHDLLSGNFLERAKGKNISGAEEFATSFGKLLLVPIGFIAKEIICVMGLLFCFHARKWYAKVEQFFYIQPKDPSEPKNFLEFHANIGAPCMQPLRFAHTENLFNYTPAQQQLYYAHHPRQ